MERRSARGSPCTARSRERRGSPPRTARRRAASSSVDRAMRSTRRPAIRARLHDPRQRERELAMPGRARDPGGGGEDERAHELRSPFGEPEGDDAAHGVAEDAPAAPSRSGATASAKPASDGAAGSGAEPPWPGRSGIDQPPPGEERRHLREVPGGAAEPVQRAGAARPRRARRRGAGRRGTSTEPLLEAGQKIHRIRHGDRLSWAMMSSSADRTGRVRRCPPCASRRQKTSPARAHARRAFLCRRTEGARWQTT